MEQDSDIAALDHQLGELDQQLNVLLEKKKDLTKQRNGKLPNAFEVLTERKRKRDIFDLHCLKNK